MPSAGWTRIIIGLAAAISIAVLASSQDALEETLPRAIGIAMNAVVLLLLIFDKWAWRWPVIRMMVRRPVLRGTWKTELLTTYEGRRDEKIDSFLVIRQTFTTIHISMLFEHSQSESTSSTLTQSAGNKWTLNYLFRSDKAALQDATNPSSRGAAVLRIAGTPKLHLEGDYWMDVGTRGQVTTVGYSHVLYDTYRGARDGRYA